MKEWVLCPEAKELVEKIIEKFPAHFSDIDPNHISCVMCVGGKPPNGGRTLAKIYVIPERIRCAAGTPYRYVLEVYDGNWLDLNDNQKQVVIFHELMHIDPESDPPKLRKHDVEDFRILLESWGIDYINNGAPQLLSDDDNGDNG